ncbi:AbfB domain-containing protein [Streptomyces sp. NPDC024017]|uniref:AbfB domain-containing protein n=1 Tax=Streptomyces sp. NPDC024017 TaxID=3154326 RepID=UPI003410B832
MSLQSVNSPTRYLRRYSCELRLDVSDGTTAFARDAAFPRTADWAGSTCTFFRSHDFPTGHITTGITPCASIPTPPPPPPTARMPPSPLSSDAPVEHGAAEPSEVATPGTVARAGGHPSARGVGLPSPFPPFPWRAACPTPPYEDGPGASPPRSSPSDSPSPVWRASTGRSRLRPCPPNRPL